MTSCLLWVPDAASTNDLAWKEGPARQADFLCVAADRQTAGRGRHGRSWISPPGKDLLFSVYLHPPAPLSPAGLVTALGAVAVCEALEKDLPHPRSVQSEASGDPLRASRFAPDGLKIRWPNDLYVGGRKLCGILAESREVEGRPAYVVGVGLNVNSAEEDWPEEIRRTATSVLRETRKPADRRKLLERILERLAALHRGDAARVAAGWAARSDLVGREVDLETAGARVRGQVLSADLAEGIVLRTPDGARRAFQAEHVTRVVTR